MLGGESKLLTFTSGFKWSEVMVNYTSIGGFKCTKVHGKEARFTNKVIKVSDPRVNLLHLVALKQVESWMRVKP